jgi:hypothetical protein
MLGMGIAKAAKLFNLHAVGVLFFVFGGVVVALFARHTGQGDFGAHRESLALIFLENYL